MSDVPETNRASHQSIPGLLATQLNVSASYLFGQKCLTSVCEITFVILYTGKICYID